ncbi:hypothetical protein DAMA08_046680 [Martiniozyma asiatica (nom. inval.)]|nr:hypothetical protein DAMA08_046680 [Martiniozyma asiatica]
MVQGTLYIHSSHARFYWAAELLKELKLEDVKIVFGRDSEEFIKNFPLNKAPAFIEHDGWTLTETPAILEYLIAASGNTKLNGVTLREKAKVLQWVNFINQDFFKASSLVNYIVPDIEDKRAEWIAKGIEIIEHVDKTLATRKWLATDEITIADIYTYKTLLGYTDSFGKVDKYEHIQRWIKDFESAAPIYKE